MNLVATEAELAVSGSILAHGRQALEVAREVLDDDSVAVSEGQVLDGERVVRGHSEPPARLVRTIR